MNKHIHRENIIITGILNLTNLKTTIYSLLLLVLACCTLQAQDIHYSQFYNAPINLNPALTGVFRGDVRFMGNYRSQWKAVPVDYLTFTGAADKKFYPKDADKNGLFSGGITFNYDRAGLSNLQLAQLGLSGSYTHRLASKSFLSVGVQLAGNNRSFSMDELTFDNNFDPGRGTVDPSLPNGENFSATNKFFLGLGAGLNLRLQNLSNADLVDDGSKRTKLDLGVGLFNINRPNQSFYDGYESRLFTRISPYASAVVQLGGKKFPFDLVGNLTWQFQGPYEEKLGMLGVRWHADFEPDRQIWFQLGSGYRFDNFGDAVYPTIEVFYRGLHVGANYDINVSGFNIATRRRGGFELSARYIINRVPNMIKVCPFI
jgi:type IX secretion system PorP/SprF family membrane protein